MRMKQLMLLRGRNRMHEAFYNPDTPVEFTRCMPCKQPVPFVADSTRVTKNGTQMAMGRCPICGGRVSKITGKLTYLQLRRASHREPDPAALDIPPDER